MVRDLGLLLSSARAVGPLDLPVTAFSLHPREYLGLAAWSTVTVDGCAEVVLSGVPRKASRTDCCCRHHKRSGGPTALDSNQLGLPHDFSAERKQPWWPGPPAGAKPALRLLAALRA